MARRLALAIAIAAAVSSADVISKARMPEQPWYDHERSAAWVALSVGVLVAAVALTRVPSRFLSVASGVLAGGVLGNLAWATAHDGVVANPLVIELGAGAIAYNVADVFVLAGILLATIACCTEAVRYRHLLPEATVATRVARRLRR